jgi:signal transduction histidine kinase
MSIAIAVLVSGVALMLAFRLRERRVLWFPPRLAASVVMGLAIAGMHYTGMAAAQFPMPAQGVGPSGRWLLAARQLATPVAAASCVIFGLTMVVGVASARRRREGERILRRAAEALAVTGPEFFETVTRELLQILDAQHAIIVTVESASAERAQTLISCCRGTVEANFSFPMAGSPCESVLTAHRICCYRSDVRERFPRHQFPSDITPVGYFGAPLMAPDGSTLGVISVLTDHAIADEGEGCALLHVFATRVAGELHQARTDQALKRSEQQRARGQKLEAIGQLAGGVAHDFNNVLTVIEGHAGFLGDEITEPRLKEHVRELATAAQRAAGLTRQLLAFAGRQVMQPRVLELNARVAALLPMLRRLVREDIALTGDLGAAVRCIRADPAQLEQVIINLVVNARDAMPGGGRLVIKTRRECVRHDGLVPAGTYEVVSVEDTGTGIDAVTQAHIFEPFFTTKGTKGTGLGLATVYGIVEQSGGHIRCRSELGQGTTFEVYLPTVEETVTACAVEESKTDAVASGIETIMVVEDDPAVRGILVAALEYYGYTTIEVAHPLHAVEVAKQHAASLALVISDMIMPGMAGPAVMAALRPVVPQARFLFVSGYTGSVLDDAGGLPADAAFLQKPFSPAALGQKVREVLDASTFA